MGGFFLALAEDLGPSGPKVTLPDGRTDERTDGRTDRQTDNGFKGVRCLEDHRNLYLISFIVFLFPA